MRFFKNNYISLLKEASVKRLYSGCLSLMLALSISGYSPLSAAQPITVNDLKAIFLFNFATFVQWPDDSFKGPDEPIRYCTMGNLRIHKLLLEVTKGESVKGRALTVSIVNDIAEVEERHCHLLFIGNFDYSVDSNFLTTMAKKNILTVGESSEFISNGGMIYLKHQRKRVKIEVGLENVQLSRLEISSKLLRLATLK